MVAELEQASRRKEMVAHQIAGRGVSSPRVLEAMGKVRREKYVPESLAEFAYADAPLPIEEGQTISQPYIVALMLEALELQGGERTLEIGTGSGYAAAALAEIAGEVYTIERHAGLARRAQELLQRDGYSNVRVRRGDGTKGWPEAAPFDAIVVTAGGPKVPEALREQLAVGGRLVIPVGEGLNLQELIRVRRIDATTFEEEGLGHVRFVPLIGAQGWSADPPVASKTSKQRPAARPAKTAELAERVKSNCVLFESIESVELEPLLERIGDARVVLMGEATHGTSEFYRFRARLTQALVEHKDFDVVAVEADWADAARIDHYVRWRDVPPSEWLAFARFPAWMWRNAEVRAFVDWLHEHNAGRERRVRFAGLDLYGMSQSIAAVLQYLQAADPATAAVARERYGCLTPWQSDPAAYGRAALTGSYRSCEPEVVAVLADLLGKRMEELRRADEGQFEALANARVVADAEAYYRAMYYGSQESWNLRDRHMFVILKSLLDFHGPASKAVVWAHNSHIGDASATEMAARGELNIGQLCRRHFDATYHLGFGTDHGTVAAASDWDGPLEIKAVRPAHERSYERICHEAGIGAFLLPLRSPRRPALRRELLEPRLERAIGVIYRPETELASHYFHAVLPFQFDEYVWFDETRAVRPLETHELKGVPETYPFGL